MGMLTVTPLEPLLTFALGEPDYPETARVSAEALVECVDSLAWSLNGVSLIPAAVDY